MPRAAALARDTSILQGEGQPRTVAAVGDRWGHPQGVQMEVLCGDRTAPGSLKFVLCSLVMLCLSEDIAGCSVGFAACVFMTLLLCTNTFLYIGDRPRVIEAIRASAGASDFSARDSPEQG